MKQTKIEITAAQETALKITNLLAKLDNNTTPVLRELTEVLATAEDPQGVFDIWGSEGLTTLLELKALTKALENLECDVPHLREDFAIPERKAGKRTGRLIFNPEKTEEIAIPPIGDET